MPKNPRDFGQSNGERNLPPEVKKIEELKKDFLALEKGGDRKVLAE